MRRTFIIVAAVIVLVGIGVVAYFYFFAKSPSIVVAPGATLPVAGQNPVSATTGDTGNTTVPATGASAGLPARLVKISVGPVVPGVAVVNIKAVNASSSPLSTSLGTGDVAISYIERQSGNIFHYLTRVGTITRTSNRTAPGIEEATWLPDASIAYVRYLSGSDFSTINTYALLDGGSNGFFLPQNLSGVATASTSVLTLASGVNGSAASLMRTDGTHSATVFTTPLSSLRVSFAGGAQYLAFTKPSATLAGNAFIVDKAGNFSRIAGPLNGLVALSSHSGKWVLVSYVRNNEMHLELVSVATGETIPLPVSTIADKCAWTTDDASIYCGIPVSPPTNYAYPDDWYQGAVFFNDRIWKIDVAGRFAQLALDFSKETGGSPDRPGLDAIALALDPAGTTLVFVNKNDGALWSYQL